MKRIDKIIKKAECIKKYLTSNGKEMGNIEELIKSLESYRDNVGDIDPEKIFWLSSKRFPSVVYEENQSMPYFRLDENGECHVYRTLGVKAVDWTTHIRKKVLKAIGPVGCEELIFSLPPEILETNIADSVFDVQTFPVNDVALSVELINAGFRPTKTNARWVCDFEINDQQ